MHSLFFVVGFLIIILENQKDVFEIEPPRLLSIFACVMYVLWNVLCRYVNWQTELNCVNKEGRTLTQFISGDEKLEETWYMLVLLSLV